MTTQTRRQRIARGARRAAACACGLAWLLCAAVCAADPWVRTDDWSAGTTAGWTNTPSKTTLTNPGGCLNLRHPAQSGPPAYVSDTLRLALPATVVPTQLVFRFRAPDTFPSELLASVRSRNGRIWSRALAPPPKGGEQTYTVPVSFDAGWRSGPNATAQDLAADLPALAWIGIGVTRHGATAAQNYQVDDVTVLGFVAPADDDGDGMPNDWELAHGLNPGDAGDGRLDSDHDGMSNYSECRAGTDPNDARSVLRADIAPAGRLGQAAAVVITWPSVSNRTYAVLRSDAPLAGFEPVAAGLAATPPRNLYAAPAATNRVFFYRIRVE